MATEFTPMASVDGAIVPLAEATVPVLDRSFLFGDSVYEVFRTYDGVPLFFEEHWQRFENSARLIYLDVVGVKETLTAEIKSASAATGARELGIDVYVRYLVTRGGGPIDLKPHADLKPRRVVIVNQVPSWNPEFYSRGATLAIVPTHRNPHGALDPNIKGGNYLNNVLGVIEAERSGADDCLMLGESGLITESSNSNVFFVIDGRLVTPSQKAANLRGLTKAAIHEACRQDGLESREIEISVDAAMRASECFLSSATREVMPVAAILDLDGRRRDFPAGGGEVTRRAARLYKAAIQDYVRRNAAFSIF